MDGYFPLDNYFSFDLLDAIKSMRAGQLNAGKNMWVNNIRFKKKFLNYFFTG